MNDETETFDPEETTFAEEPKVRRKRRSKEEMAAARGESTAAPPSAETAQALAGTYNFIARIVKSKKRFKASDFSEMASTLKSQAKRFPILARILEILGPLLVVFEAIEKLAQVMEERPAPEPEPFVSFTANPQPEQTRTGIG